MGKASSAKKVARAAGTGGGRTTRGRAPLTYYGVILVVVILGVAATFASRSTRLTNLATANKTAAPTVGSTENAAFAVDICGTLAPNIKTTKNPVGITTQGDGIIHIHPLKASAAGANATLGLFASSIGMKLTTTDLALPGGKDHVAGNSCHGQPAQVYVRRFAYPGAPASAGVVQGANPDSVHLDDGSEYTIAFVAPSQKGKIPPPPASVVATLTSLEAATNSTTTTAPSTTAPSTTAPG